MSSLAQPASACSKHKTEAREVKLNLKILTLDIYLTTCRELFHVLLHIYTSGTNEQYFNNVLLVIFNGTKPFLQWKSSRLGVENTACVDVSSMPMLAVSIIHASMVILT